MSSVFCQNWQRRGVAKSLEKQKIDFLLIQNLDGYFFNPHLPEGIEFIDDETGLNICIKSDGDGYDELKIRSAISECCSAKASYFVNALIEGKYLNCYDSGIDLPFSKGEKELVAPNGSIAKGYSIRWEMMPNELQELGNQVRNHLVTKTKRFVALLRWQHNALGPNSIGYSRNDIGTLYWKTHQHEYHCTPLPSHKTMTIRIGDGGMLWTKANQDRLKSVWSNDKVMEPLGHELLREARQLQGSNERSALLIAYSALEVGLKQHISSILPKSTWLVSNAPTPPIVKIVKTYLPELYSTNDDFKNWSGLKKRLKLLDSFTEDRNMLAHRGKEISGDIEDYIELVSDLLYAFDVYEGNEWAKKRISPWFSSILGWDGADHLQITITEAQS